MGGGRVSKLELACSWGDLPDGNEEVFYDYPVRQQKYKKFGDSLVPPFPPSPILVLLISQSC